MRVLGACSLGGAGHWGPLSAVLAAARRRGDAVAVVAPTTMEPMVRRAGFEWLDGSEPTEAQIAPIREQLPILDAKSAAVLGNRELFGRLATTAMLPAVRRVVGAWRPDLIVRDPCEYASAVVAAEVNVRVLQVAISRSDGEWTSIDAASPALEEHREGLTEAVRATPYLTRFPASMDPERFSTTVRVRERRAGARPLPDWWGGSDRPLLYATFGTVLGHMSIAVSSLAVLLEAVDAVDARVLLTTGAEVDPEALGPAPSNVVLRRWVDQDDIVAVASAVVCHGGSATTLGALASGRPVVVVPMFADQFDNAWMVQRAGGGGAVERGRAGERRRRDRADVAPMRAGVESVMGDSEHRRQAERVAAEMAAASEIESVLSEWA